MPVNSGDRSRSPAYHSRSPSRLTMSIGVAEALWLRRTLTNILVELPEEGVLTEMLLRQLGRQGAPAVAPPQRPGFGFAPRFAAALASATQAAPAVFAPFTPAGPPPGQDLHARTTADPAPFTPAGPPPGQALHARATADPASFTPTGPPPADAAVPVLPFTPATSPASGSTAEAATPPLVHSVYCPVLYYSGTNANARPLCMCRPHRYTGV